MHIYLIIYIELGSSRLPMRSKLNFGSAALVQGPLESHESTHHVTNTSPWSPWEPGKRVNGCCWNHSSDPTFQCLRFLYIQLIWVRRSKNTSLLIRLQVSTGEKFHTYLTSFGWLLTTTILKALMMSLKLFMNPL